MAKAKKGKSVTTATAKKCKTKKAVKTNNYTKVVVQSKTLLFQYSVLEDIDKAKAFLTNMSSVGVSKSDYKVLTFASEEELSQFENSVSCIKASSDHQIALSDTSDEKEHTDDAKKSPVISVLLGVRILLLLQIPQMQKRSLFTLESMSIHHLSLTNWGIPLVY